MRCAKADTTLRLAVDFHQFTLFVRSVNAVVIPLVVTKMDKPKVNRLPLASPRWDESGFEMTGGARSRLQAILDAPLAHRGNLIRDFVDDTELVDCPCFAFYYASPYLVDTFEADFDSNWIAFPAYCSYSILAFNGVIGPHLDQIWGDRHRIAKLVLSGLERPEQRHFELFVGCIAAVYGDEVLARNIQNRRCDSD